MTADRSVWGLRVEIDAAVMGLRGPHAGVALFILDSNRVVCHVPLYPNRHTRVITDIQNVRALTTVFGEPLRHPLYPKPGDPE